MLLHFCRHLACCAVDPAGAAASPRPRARLRHLTIDLHAHTLCLAAERLVADAPQKRAEPEIQRRTMGAASVAHNDAVMLPRAFPKLTQLATRLADMDAMGVDVQVISPSPAQYFYWAEPELARELVRVQNEAIAEACAQHPRRLAGLGALALQHPALACEQLEHAVRTLGLKGVEISSSVGARELSDPAFRPVWAKAEALGALLFLHPFGTSLGERTATHYLANTIGQPLETAVALSHLIFGGVLDAHPGLRIVAAHGGGYLPTSIGRSDHAHAVRPEAAAGTPRPPSEHLRRIWFDTVLFDPLALRHLVDRVGPSQVVVGTDYPFDMGQYEVHRLVEDTPGLGDDERRAILGGNAARLIGWPETQPA